MNIYLDVDGVLLNEGKPSEDVDDFIDYVISNYPNSTYWLTTRCRGNAEETLTQLSHLFTDAILDKLRKVKATSWPIVKSQAIDFTRPFIWFDDQLGFADRNILVDNNALDNLVLVDLTRNPSQLRYFVEDFPLPVQEFKQKTAW